jgi:hypothetical protein
MILETLVAKSKTMTDTNAYGQNVLIYTKPRMIYYFGFWYKNKIFGPSTI